MLQIRSWCQHQPKQLRILVVGDMLCQISASFEIAASLNKCAEMLSFTHGKKRAKKGLFEGPCAIEISDELGTLNDQHGKAQRTRYKVIPVTEQHCCSSG
jgi:hypothetical protein